MQKLPRVHVLMEDGSHELFCMKMGSDQRDPPGDLLQRADEEAVLWLSIHLLWEGISA